MRLRTERHAALLAATGYRTPPPQPAHLLIDETRRAVAAAPAGSRSGVVHLEEARAALRNFLDHLDKHLPAANSYLPDRLLRRAHRVGLAGGLLLMLANTSIKTGDEFDVNFGASLLLVPSVEVTVPKPWSVEQTTVLVLKSGAMEVGQSVAAYHQTLAPSFRHDRRTTIASAGQYSAEPPQHAPRRDARTYSRDEDELGSLPPQSIPKGASWAHRYEHASETGERDRAPEPEFAYEPRTRGAGSSA